MVMELLPKIKVAAGLELGESMFPGLQVEFFLLYPHLMERETEKANSFKALVTRALIPFNLLSD